MSDETAAIRARAAIANQAALEALITIVFSRLLDDVQVPEEKSRHARVLEKQVVKQLSKSDPPLDAWQTSVAETKIASIFAPYFEGPVADEGETQP